MKRKVMPLASWKFKSNDAWKLNVHNAVFIQHFTEPPDFFPGFYDMLQNIAKNNAIVFFICFKLFNYANRSFKTEIFSHPINNFPRHIKSVNFYPPISAVLHPKSIAASNVKH